MTSYPNTHPTTLLPSFTTLLSPSHHLIPPPYTTLTPPYTTTLYPPLYHHPSPTLTPPYTTTFYHPSHTLYYPSPPLHHLLPPFTTIGAFEHLSEDDIDQVKFLYVQYGHLKKRELAVKTLQNKKVGGMNPLQGPVPGFGPTTGIYRYVDRQTYRHK